MENKVIEVLDYMCEKVGIVIDWTAENVVPQAMEFLGRYQTYAIVKHSIWVLISMAVLFASHKILKSIFSAYKKDDEESIWLDRWGLNTFAIMTCIFIGFIALTFTCSAIFDIFDIVEWVFIPEMQFIEVFSQYLK
jgi:hypothetical protein